MEMQVTPVTPQDGTSTWTHPRDGQVPTQQQPKTEGQSLAAQTTVEDDADKEVIDPKQFREVLKDRNAKNKKLQEYERRMAEIEKAAEAKKLAEMTEVDKARAMLTDLQKELEQTKGLLRTRDVLIGLSNARVDPAYQDVLAALYDKRSSEITLDEFLGEQRKARPALFAGAPETEQPKDQPPPASAGGPQSGGPSGSQRAALESELKAHRAKRSRHPTDVAREMLLIRQLEGMRGK